MFGTKYCYQPVAHWTYKTHHVLVRLLHIYLFYGSVGLGGNDALLRSISRETREVVAGILETQDPTANLVIEGNRLVSAQKLLQSAAKQENISTDEYLRLLRTEGIDGGLYGGGPELTVLANVLRRPISIYELDTKTSKDSTLTERIAGSASQELPTGPDVQLIQRMGVFGADTFQDPLQSIPNSAVLSPTQPQGAYSWHLHILVVDVSPNEKHACVLLPQD